MERSRDEEEAFDAITSCCYTSEVVRSLERPFLEEGVPLMRMAADAVSAIARSMLAREGMDQSQAGVVLLAGGGDNGGDGLYACADLAARGYDVTCVATGRGLHEGGAQAFQDAGGVIISIDTASNIPSSQAPADVQEARGQVKTLEPILNHVDPKRDILPGGLKFSSADNSTLQNNNTAILNTAMTKFAQWTTKGGVDAEWDQYLDTLKKANLDQSIKLEQKAYDEYYVK